MPNRVLEISDDVTVTSLFNKTQQNFVFLFIRQRNIFVQNLSNIRQETKKLQKMANDVISTNSTKIFCVRVVFTIPIYAPIFKLIEGKIKELQGWYQTPPAQNDQKAWAR